jgi:hypothetical protein
VVADDTGQSQSGHDEEVLMDLIEQVLQVGVHTGLRVNCVLFVGQQVVELHDSYSHGLKLL